MYHFHIIYNQKSGNKHSYPTIEKIQHYFKSTHISYSTIGTIDTFDGLIDQLGSMPNYQDIILIIGGDGTLHHLINCLVKHQLKTPIMIIPSGTGNDFSRYWQQNKSPEKLLQKFMNKQWSSEDIPIIQWHNHQNHSHGVIVNSMGIGLDAQANFETTYIQRSFHPLLIKVLKKLNLMYIAGLLRVLFNIPQFELKVTCDDQTTILPAISIATLVNNPFLGGGIMIDNQSKPNFKTLALITYHHIDFKAVIELLVKVLIFKNQQTSKHVTRFEGSHIHVKVKEPQLCQMDGESFTETVDFSYQITSHPFYLL